MLVTDHIINNNRVQVFGLYDSSYVVRQWGQKGEGEGDFAGPSGIAASEDEVFVSCTHRV